MCGGLDGVPCSAGGGACQTATIGAVDVINLFLEDGIIHKTHIIDKNYIQPNPHSPTTIPPTPAPVLSTCPTPS